MLASADEKDHRMDKTDPAAQDARSYLRAISLCLIAVAGLLCTYGWMRAG